MFAVNILGPRNGISTCYKFDDESKAVAFQVKLEAEGIHRVEFVNLNYFPNRQK